MHITLGLASLLLCATVVVSACGANDAARAAPGVLDDTSTTYRVVDSGSTRQIDMRPVAEITLTAATDWAPKSVTRLAATADGFALLDDVQRVVALYDRSGTLRSIIGAAQTGGALKKPIAIASSAHEYAIADFFASNGVFLVADTGGSARRVSLDLSSATINIAMTDSVIAVASVGVDGQLKKGVVPLASVLTRSGTRRASFCSIHNAYARSVQKRGKIGTLRGFRISILDNEVYCVQPISPVVHVFGLDGHLMRTLTLAPYFYKPPKDTAFSASEIQRLAYDMTWTRLAQFYPITDGFIAIYSRVDPGLNTEVFTVFRCTRLSGPVADCAIARSEDEPLALLAPDTLVTVALGEVATARTRLRLLRLGQ